jgi:hypothetical protein
MDTRLTNYDYHQTTNDDLTKTTDTRITNYDYHQTTNDQLRLYNEQFTKNYALQNYELRLP